MKTILSLLLAFLSLTANAQDFVRVEDNHFIKDGKPYYFIGTNFWYGPILGMKTTEGNRKRLKAELDTLHSLGLNNLRILVGAEAGSKNVTSVTPYLQPQRGTINNDVLDGLDFLLSEMSKRNMLAVLYLTNSWDWSGGYGFYLREAGYGDSPDAAKDWNGYCQYAAKMNTDTLAQHIFHRYVQKIVARKNSYTGKLYKDDPTIMAWQLCNEPRPFLQSANEGMVHFLTQTAHIIKQIDSNHMISIGSEGTIGCAYDKQLCTRIHLCPDIDYTTIHIWPKNWQWTSNECLYSSLNNVYLKSKDYITTNLRIAHRLHKPTVIEEFGYPRNKGLLTPNAHTHARDCFYNFIFSIVAQNAKEGGIISGCNFWGWGGKGRPSSKRWKVGDDFLCDPPHEPQGWYSVYDSDSTTLQLIRKYASIINTH